MSIQLRGAIRTVFRALEQSSLDDVTVMVVHPAGVVAHTYYPARWMLPALPRKSSLLV